MQLYAFFFFVHDIELYFQHLISTSYLRFIYVNSAISLEGCHIIYINSRIYLPDFKKKIMFSVLIMQRAC